MTRPQTQARKLSRRSAITVRAIIDLRTVAVDGHGLDIGVIMKASTCAKWSIRATGRVCFGCYVEVNHQQLGGLAAIEELLKINCLSEDVKKPQLGFRG